MQINIKTVGRSETKSNLIKKSHEKDERPDKSIKFRQPSDKRNASPRKLSYKHATIKQAPARAQPGSIDTDINKKKFSLIQLYRHISRFVYGNQTFS